MLYQSAGVLGLYLLVGACYALLFVFHGMEADDEAIRGNKISAYNSEAERISLWLMVAVVITLLYPGLILHSIRRKFSHNEGLSIISGLRWFDKA